MKQFGSIFTLFCLAALSILFPRLAAASIATVHIDSNQNTYQEPASVFLGRGSYGITPIGTQDGGNYDAWNAWGYVDLPEYGWLNSYTIYSDEFSPVNYWDGVMHETPAKALSGALPATVSLETAGFVHFFAKDQPHYYFDNIGGMSLEISPITVSTRSNGQPTPIPGSSVLLFTGLTALVAFRRRQKK